MDSSKVKTHEIFHSKTELLTELNKKNSTSDICELKNQNRWLDYGHYTVPAITFEAIDLEIILPTQIARYDYADMLNLIRASYKIDGSDWEKALVSTKYTAKYTR